MKITLKEFRETLLDITSQICELVVYFKDHWEVIPMKDNLSLGYCLSQIEPYDNCQVVKISSNYAGLIIYIIQE